MLLLLLFYSTKTWTIFPSAGIPDNSVRFDESQRQLTMPFVPISSQGHCTQTFRYFRVFFFSASKDADQRGKAKFRKHRTPTAALLALGTFVGGKKRLASASTRFFSQIVLGPCNILWRNTFISTEDLSKKSHMHC